MYSVYRIINKVNGKSYIGITSRPINQRWLEHRSRVNCYERFNKLYLAIRKYGEENFDVESIANSSSQDVIRELEKVYIQKYDSYENGYNCNLGGQGHLHIPESLKKKISDAQIGKIISLESRFKMSAAKLGDSRCANNFGNHTNEGSENPRAGFYKIQFPDGHVEIISGLRKFCRDNNLAHCKLSARGRTKGFVLQGRFRDYPETEYAQAGGSGAGPVETLD